LVTVIPALMISISGALIVTRASSEARLGAEFHKQILGNSQPILLAGGGLGGSAGGAGRASRHAETALPAARFRSRRGRLEHAQEGSGAVRRPRRRGGETRGLDGRIPQGGQSRAWQHAVCLGAAADGAQRCPPTIPAGAARATSRAAVPGAASPRRSARHCPL